MKITVNPETKSSGGFGYAAEGEYELRVVECTQKQKQGSEYPYLNWQFEFTDSSISAVEPDTKLGAIFEITTLKNIKPDDQFRLREVCDALGVEWGDFDTEDVKGMTLKAKVCIDAYQGQKRNQVDRFIPASK